MDRFEAMSVLLAVVEAGSLSAGARQLRAPLATVSRKVADLERHLGTRLVVRTSRRLGLTDAGRAYVAASRRILAQLEEAEREAAGAAATPSPTPAPTTSTGGSNAVNTTEAAIQAALADLGIIRVLSYQVEDELRSGRLQVVLAEFAPEPLPVNLVYPQVDPLPLKVRCVLDWTVPRRRVRMAALHADDV